jgi:hypothetical protein
MKQPEISFLVVGLGEELAGLIMLSIPVKQKLFQHGTFFHNLCHCNF